MSNEWKRRPDLHPSGLTWREEAKAKKVKVESSQSTRHGWTMERGHTMGDLLLPIVEEEWKKSPIPAGETPLITTLGLIEGEVLTFLEEHGATTLRALIRELEWPARMVMMAVGALVREHLVRATQRELEVILEPLPALARREQRSDAWSG